MSSAKKILIIRFSSIGDIVLASPVFRCVKKQLPDVQVHFLTKKSFKAVTQHNPYIDRFFYLDDNMEVMKQLLSTENYDVVIDLHNNIRSHQIKTFLGAETYTIDKLTWQKFLLTKLKINLMPDRHITTRSLDTVAPLGVVDDGLGLDYFIHETEEIRPEDIPASHQLGYVAMVIGANHRTKKMPLNKWQELCLKLRYPVILIGGPTEKEEGDIIASVDPSLIYNSCGKFSLNETADLVRKSRLVLSHDTGFQYIACAFRKEVIAIWGGTSPKLGVEPYYGSSYLNAKPILYENVLRNMWCQPCSKYGTKRCPLGHFNCMKKIDIDALVMKVKSRIK